jgi:hypothetical protein
MRAEDVRALARGGALLLAAGVGTRLLEWAFSSRPLLAVIVSAFLLDMWSQRVRARWMPVPPQHRRELARRLAQGLGIGVAMGVAVVAICALLGQARMHPSRASAAGLALGTLRTGAVAFRDELLYRGIPLALSDGHLPARSQLAFCAVLGAAPLVLATGRIEALLLAGFAALYFALVWQVGRGGFFAWANHAGWLFATQVLSQGAIVDVEWVKGSLASTSESGGIAAYAGAASFAAAAVILARSKRAAPR